MKPLPIILLAVAGFLIGHYTITGTLSFDSVLSIFRSAKKESQWLAEFERTIQDVTLCLRGGAYGDESYEAETAQKIREITKKVAALRAELPEVEKENISYSRLEEFGKHVEYMALFVQYAETSCEMQELHDAIIDFKNEYLSCAQAYDNKRCYAE